MKQKSVRVKDKMPILVTGKADFQNRLSPKRVWATIEKKQYSYEPKGDSAAELYLCGNFNKIANGVFNISLRLVEENNGNSYGKRDDAKLRAILLKRCRKSQNGEFSGLPGENGLLGKAIGKLFEKTELIDRIYRAAISHYENEKILAGNMTRSVQAGL